MEGLLRLEQEALETNNHNIILIFNHLKEFITQKEKFNHSEKNIKDMYSFICDKARKSATDNVAIIDDKVVFLWAYNYFDKSNDELGITKKAPIPSKKETTVNNSNNTSQISIFEEVKNNGIH